MSHTRHRRGVIHCSRHHTVIAHAHDYFRDERAVVSKSLWCTTWKQRHTTTHRHWANINDTVKTTRCQKAAESAHTELNRVRLGRESCLDWMATNTAADRTGVCSHTVNMSLNRHTHRLSLLSHIWRPCQPLTGCGLHHQSCYIFSHSCPCPVCREQTFRENKMREHSTRA